MLVSVFSRVFVSSRTLRHFTGSNFGLGLERLEIFDADQRRLSSHSNYAIITEKNPATAVKCSAGDALAPVPVFFFCLFVWFSLFL